MKARALIVVLALLHLTPLRAEGVDDATCGLIAEYAMDLAMDAGAPMELQPQGRIAAEQGGCALTHVLVAAQGPSALMVERLTWTGEGLADWVAGKGWPSRLELTFERAYLWASIPDFAALEWANRLTARRSTISGAMDISWDKASGILTVGLIEAGTRRNWIRLSGLASGIIEDPLERSMPTLRLHALEADVTFDGMFETLVLTPFVVGLLTEKANPAAGFAALVDVAQSYIARLPAPQVDTQSRLALGAFVDTLPAPTGRLQVFLKGEGGIALISAMPLAADMGRATPAGVGGLIKELLGPAQLTVNWHPGPPR